MKALLHSLVFAAAAGLGLGAGFAWRASSEPGESAARPRATAPPEAAVAETNFRPKAARLAFVPVRDDSPLATRLERALSMSSSITRWLHWLEALEQAGLSDGPRLARLAQRDATAARLLAARWTALDPRHLFDFLAAPGGRAFAAGPLAEVLFDEWPRRDPAAAVAALSGTNHFASRDTWRINVAGLLMEKDPERGLRALSAWRIENFGPRMTGVARWAAGDPRRAAEFALAHPAGYATELALETIGREWAKAEPARALEFAAGRSDAPAAALAGHVLKHWGRASLQEAADWLRDAEPAARSRFLPAFVESWAARDARGALAWCEANLRDETFALAAGAVAQGAAQSDVAAAAALVAAMPASGARAEAAAVVAQKWFPGSLSGKPVPPAVLEWMAGLDDVSARRALERVQWRWSIGDPNSMAEFLATTAGERVPATADSTLARNLARQSPAAALAWAGRLPGGRGLAAGSEAFAEWRRAQPEPAAKWLNELPPADPRRNFFGATVAP